jgi:hypothetical protein
MPAKKQRPCRGLPWVPAFAGTTLRKTYGPSNAGFRFIQAHGFAKYSEGQFIAIPLRNRFSP